MEILDVVIFIAMAVVIGSIIGRIVRFYLRMFPRSFLWHILPVGYLELVFGNEVVDNSVSGQEFCNEIADYIGVPRSLYALALLEVDVSWADFKAMHKRGISVETAAHNLMHPLEAGLLIIKDRFGPQSSVMEALERIGHREVRDDVAEEQVYDDRPLCGSAAAMITLQLQFSGVEARSLRNDPYALGYAFGLCDMAFFQGGGELGKQAQALDYIGFAFKLFAEDNAISLLEIAIQSQEEELFDAGRECGANDLGDWVKSQGRKKPQGLIVHYLGEDDNLSE